MDKANWKAIDTFGARVQHAWMTHPLTKEFVKSGCGELYHIERLKISPEFPRCKKCSKRLDILGLNYNG